ncbi:MAG: DUF4294 domain-containing protein [Chitinophagaceae bacterium]|nr:DUF4294 domain-containing protein [Chitinophagaceae bacterium]
MIFSLSAVAQQYIDTQLHVQMKPVDITAKHQWANDTIQYQYNQMKYYVKTILPYLDEAVVLFRELDNKINDPNASKKETKEFVKTKEQILKERFDSEIKALNETQGVLLIKLIARQTHVNIYGILKEFKNPMAAMKWQGWAKIHGFNLNRKYDPDDEPWLEQIMEDYGYPLPKSYKYKQIITSN